MNLQKLSKLADAFAPRSRKITSAIEDLDNLIDRELINVAKAIDAAAKRLNRLINKLKKNYNTYELRIYDSILETIIVVTNVIAQLIKVVTTSQQEIVKKNCNLLLRSIFYKRNNC